MNKAISLAIITLVSLFGSTSAAPPMGPGPVVIPFQIRVYNPLTAEIASPFLTCSGTVTRNASLAGNYYHYYLPPSTGELRCGAPENPLIGAPGNASSAVFKGFEGPGSINTAFSIDNNNALVWKNSKFGGGKAKFYQSIDIYDDKVYAQFKGLQLAESEPVSLVAQTFTEG